jgi:hypothetical protein
VRRGGTGTEETTHQGVSLHVLRLWCRREQLERVLLVLLVHLLGNEPHVMGGGGQIGMSQGCLYHLEARLIADMGGCEGMAHRVDPRSLRVVALRAASGARGSAPAGVRR